MKIISESDSVNLRYTLAPRTMEAVYDKLQEVLPRELASVFLKPKKKGNTILWGIESETIEVYEIRRYSTLDEGQKNLVSDKLTELFQVLLSTEKDHPQLKGLSKDICSIPELDCAKLLQTNKGEKVVLADWAHLYIDRSKGYKSFEKLTSKPRQIYPVKISVTYSDGSIASGEKIAILYKTFSKELEVDDSGEIDLGKLPAGSQISVYRMGENGKQGLGEIYTSPSQEYYPFTIAWPTDLSIRVKDEEGNAILDYELQIEAPSQSGIFSTENGIINLYGLLAGDEVEITDPKHPDNHISYRLQKSGNELDFIIKTPPVIPPTEPGLTKFFVYDYDRAPVKDFDLELRQKDNVLKSERSGKGYNEVPSDALKAGEKYKAFIYPDNDNSKYYKASLKLDQVQDEYHLKYKRNYWWLLLLLIPLLLLLLLSFEKDIKVEVKDDLGNSIEQANVNLQYNHLSLYDFSSGTFFKNSKYSSTRSVNNEGEVLFDSLKFTAFDFIFFNFRDANFSVISNDACYSDFESTSMFYYCSDPYAIILPPAKGNMVFQVVNRATMAPISNAKVTAEISYQDAPVMEEVFYTNNEGKVELEQIPYCGKVEKIVGEKEGFFPDSILQQPLFEIIDEIEKRTLFLSEPFPCNNSVESGDISGGTFVFNVPKENEYYTLQFDFRNIPDICRVYSGSSTNGKLIYDSGLVSGNKNIQILPSKDCNSCEQVTVVIEGGGSGTQWDMEFKCP